MAFTIPKSIKTGVERAVLTGLAAFGTNLLADGASGLSLTAVHTAEMAGIAAMVVTLQRAFTATKVRVSRKIATLRKAA